MQEGYRGGVIAGREVLSWPAEWSALHGIAEIRTPVFKLAVDTDATATSCVVRVRGSLWPDGAARGLRYPYTLSFDTSVTSPDTHTQNGFESPGAMILAHLDLLHLLDPIVDRLEGSILDLGCGTGHLLRALGAGKRNLLLHGVDRDAGKIARARTMLGQTAALHVGDFTDKTGPWLDTKHSIIIGTLNLGESSELPQLVDRMCSSAPIVILYYYEGYRGDIREKIAGFDQVVSKLPSKAMTRIGERCWAVFDTRVSSLANLISKSN
jgi:SAM-dependent methyltransferase